MLPGEPPVDDEGAGLRGQSLYNWLRTAGEALFTNFPNATQALQNFRELGGHIRDSVWYSIYDQVTSPDRVAMELASVDDNVLIPLAYTVTNHGLNISENFLYRFNVTGTVISTGEIFERRYGVASMYQLSKQEAADMLTSMLANAEEESAMTIESMELDSALGAPGLW